LFPSRNICEKKSPIFSCIIKRAYVKSVIKTHNKRKTSIYYQPQ